MKISAALAMLLILSQGRTAPPKGLSTQDWSSIRATYEANRHAAVPDALGYHARNYSQQWMTQFDGRGFTVKPDNNQWTWGLELKSFGFANNRNTVEAKARIVPEPKGLRYFWKGIEEWYVNDASGLEHGFTLRSRPAGTGGPLVLELGVRGNLQPQVSSDGRSVAFGAVNYSGLKVWDADGKLLPARFEPAATGLRLSVDESAARYPLIIDPTAQQAYLKASNTESADFFGQSVAVSGNTVVVGAFGEASSATGVNGDQSSNSAETAGAAYVFVRNGSAWTQQAYLKASNTGAGDYFGYAVAISGDTIVVGAMLEDSNVTGVGGDGSNNSAADAGAAYVFIRNGSTWTQQAYLKASNTDAADNFGESVAISGDTIVVGASRESSSSTGINASGANNSSGSSGAAYIFVRGGSTWSQQAYVKASNTGGFDLFGKAVAISGDTVVVGAFGEDSNATGINGDATNNSSSGSGAAYVYVRTGSAWSQQAYLKPSNTGQGDSFGFSVGISGDTVIVGAYSEKSNATGVNGDGTNNSLEQAGAAYIFVRVGAAWSQQAYLKASNTGEGDAFGIYVAVSGDIAIVGAPYEDSSAIGINGNTNNDTADGSGAAYVFVRSSGIWSQNAYLKASNSERDDNFGLSVAADGDTVVVGAFGEDSSTTGVNSNGDGNGAGASGAAYVFTVSTAPKAFTTVSAASYLDVGVAPESIASAFGQALAGSVVEGQGNPLPTTVGGVSVSVTDSSSAERPAGIYLVSPGQVNFVVPASVLPGVATVSIGGQTRKTAEILVTRIAPGLFALNPAGLAAVNLIRFSNGVQTLDDVFSVSNGQIVAKPIVFGPASEDLYLVLFGTGIRGRLSLGSVTVTIGGSVLNAAYAGQQPTFPGLDQVNIGPLPRSLQGKGLVDVILTVEGQQAKTVKLQFQ